MKALTGRVPNNGLIWLWMRLASAPAVMEQTAIGTTLPAVADVVGQGIMAQPGGQTPFAPRGDLAIKQKSVATGMAWPRVSPGASRIGAHNAGRAVDPSPVFRRKGRQGWCGQPPH